MTTFQLLGIQFGVSESTANSTFTLISHIIPTAVNKIYPHSINYG
ncbi:MAG: transposase family protein [Cuspidothrix sp.]